MTIRAWVIGAMMAATGHVAGAADEAIIRVDASKVIHRVSPWLQGACIEDVNHEIYGGLYSQMVFGESFQEPPRAIPPAGFAAFGGEWSVKDGVLDAAPGAGPKLVAEGPPVGDGEVSVEVRFPDARAGNAGLIVRVARPGVGADAFTGYEISLETEGFLVLGRHRRNWEPIRRIPCEVPVGRWIPLVARMKGATIEVLVDGQVKLTHEDNEHPLIRGGVGLRDWQRPVSFRNLRIQAEGSDRTLAFEPRPALDDARGVSGMWAPARTGSAKGKAAIEATAPFVGKQAQRITFEGGEGTFGVENRGLNRQGMHFEAGQPYEGTVYLRSEAPARVKLALQDAEGARTLAEATVEVRPGDSWSAYPFTLKPTAPALLGRFAILMDRPGSVAVGYAMLQPGDWGRFRGLPVRKDVAEALVDQGIAILRHGGSMVNHAQYRWKSMIGPRATRPPHEGTWYPYSTNGWGIFDFLDFCEAAGFRAIPAVNANESPQDMADFVEYVNGSAEGEWGRKRALDGHHAPYRLKHLEIGNEEAVDEAYWKKFEAIAEAVWARDPAIILVVGDFAYNQVIIDPYRFEGGAAAKSLAAHKKILDLAKVRGREVWFDIHVWTDHPPEPGTLAPERSYIEQLGKIAPGAPFKVAIFEYNSGNHAMKRALSDALATNQAERIGDLLPVACAANCLQVDRQNDNGWDQGLLFLDPAKVWLQPPGYLVKMATRQYQPLLVRSEVAGEAGPLSVNAKRSEDGKILVLQVVNPGEEARPGRIEVEGFAPAKPSGTVEQLSGPLDLANTAAEPSRIVPRVGPWEHGMKGGRAAYTFPPRSITYLRLE